MGTLKNFIPSQVVKHYKNNKVIIQYALMLGTVTVMDLLDEKSLDGEIQATKQ